MRFQYTEKKVNLPENVHKYAEKKVMKLELTAPSKTQGRSLQRAFEQQAEAIYNGIMKQLLRQPE